MANAGANRLNIRRTLADAQPWAAPGVTGNPLHYPSLNVLGINVIEETVYVNTAAVKAVVHSLLVTPGAVIPVVQGAPAVPISIAIHSNANNTVVGLRGYTHTTLNPTNAQVRVYFFPPAS